MLDCRMAAAFEHVDEADEIAGDIFIGTGQGTAYPGLRRQMNYGIEIAVTEKALHTGPVSQIEREEPESGTHAELAKPSILEPRVVVVVKVVYANNLEPICEKAVDEMSANEAGGAGDQDSFVFCLLHRFLSHLSCALHRSALVSSLSG